MLLRRLAILLLAGMLLAACGGSGKTVAKTATQTGSKSVGAYLDDIVGLFRHSSIDEVASGGVGKVDDVFRTNRSFIDDAFRAGVFATAADDAARLADSQVKSKVAELFDNLDEFVQAKAEKKIQSMICEARLVAYDEQGDVELFKPWIERQFGEIDITLNAALEPIAQWLAEKVNDKTSTYSLACTVWLRVTS